MKTTPKKPEWHLTFFSRSVRCTALVKNQFKNWYSNPFLLENSKIIFCRYHEHEVDDDVVECETVQDEKCEDVTQGYTTEQKCTKWPREVCTKETKRTLKYSPETDCKKVPRDLCGPSGCILQPGPEECFDKKETVITEVYN